jgi:hypothetical protein
MKVPLQSRGVTRRASVCSPGDARTTSGEIYPYSKITNHSNQDLWISVGNRKYCLKPGENSDQVGIPNNDADGLLLDGRSVLFDSVRSDLGGGQIHRQGAIKICDGVGASEMDVYNGSGGPTQQLRVEISTTGFICRLNDPAGYKDAVWCSQHPGWDVRTAPMARSC